MRYKYPTIFFNRDRAPWGRRLVACTWVDLCLIIAIVAFLDRVAVFNYILIKIF